MSRELTLEAPFELPNNRFEAVHMRMWFTSQQNQIGRWGKDGRSVGLGYTWYTRRSLGNERLVKLTRRITRALKSCMVLDPLCDPYNMEQKIVYIRDGDGHGTITLKED